MRLALSLNYSGAAISLDTAKILEAERLGYDSVWTAEAYGSDAVVPAAWIAARTERIHVGTAIMQIPARTPAMTAMTAMTLDASPAAASASASASPGPRWPRAGTASRSASRCVKTREYVEIVRAILAPGKPVEFRGEYYQIPYAGPGATGSASRFARSCTAAPTCRSIWPRSVRRTSPSPPRSRTAGFRCSSPPAARSCSTSG